MSYACLCCADIAVVPLEVVDWGAQGVRDVTAIIEHIKQHYNPHLTLLGYIPSRFRRARETQQTYLTALRENYGSLTFDTVIPDLAEFERSVVNDTPVVLHAPHSEEAAIITQLFDEIASRAKQTTRKIKVSSRQDLRQPENQENQSSLPGNGNIANTGQNGTSTGANSGLSSLANPGPQTGASGSAGASQQSFDQSFTPNSYLGFESNQGQVQGHYDFFSRNDGYTIFLGSSGATIALSPSGEGASEEGYQFVDIGFVGAHADIQAEGVGEQAGHVNYLFGNDPSQWVTNVSTYDSVSFEGIYEGIDLVYYHNAEGSVEYDFVVDPGVSPDQIGLSFGGVDSLEIDTNGNLLLGIGDAELVQEAPIIYQTIDGLRQDVAGEFVIGPNNQVGFDIGEYDTTRELIVDPIITYSTYLGGSGDEHGMAVFGDDDGNIFTTGFTKSTNFPLSQFPQITPLDSGLSGGQDAFVTKFDKYGDRVYSTYLGGDGADSGFDIAADSSGKAYIIGKTESTDFPIVNAYQSSLSGSRDGYLFVLGANGAGLSYGSYFGGENSDQILDLSLASDGIVYVAGETKSSDMPNKNAYQTEKYGDWDAFVAKFDTTESNGDSLIYSTFFGGNDDEVANAVDIDSDGNAYIGGQTWSDDLPTASPYQSTLDGNVDGFVAKFNSSGNGLTYATYFGGNEGDEEFEEINDIDVYEDGNNDFLFATGYTDSTNLPTTTGAYQGNQGDRDAFAVKFNHAGSGLEYSTYLGGSGSDVGSSIDVDEHGAAYLTGGTFSSNFPLARATQREYGGSSNEDAFVTKLSQDGKAIDFSTYVGTSSSDGSCDGHYANGILYVTGTTDATDFDLVDPFQSTNGGGKDAWIVRFSDKAPPPVPVSRTTPLIDQQPGQSGFG